MRRIAAAYNFVIGLLILIGFCIYALFGGRYRHQGAGTNQPSGPRKQLSDEEWDDLVERSKRAKNKDQT